jgi:CBS domain-containing protein
VGMNVETLMTRSVGTCRPSDGLDQAARTMKSHDCGCVVVTDGCGHPTAIVTDRDICLCSLRTLRPLQMIHVSDAMSTNVITCRPEDSAMRAQAIMCQNRVRRLPVVDADGHLVGILSLDDIAREAASERDLFAPRVPANEVGMTLAAVSRRHIVVEEPPAQYEKSR